MDIRKFAPWNWFRKEEESGSAVPVQHRRPEEAVERGGFSAMAELDREMDRLFGDLLRRSGLPSLAGTGVSGLLDSAALKPRVDIAVDEGKYTITAEIAGVDEKDITLELSDDILIIRGHKEQRKEDKKTDYYCVERSYGSFQRMLNLPADADREDITAQYKRGVLTVTIPRWQSAEPEKKQIEIKTD